MAEDLPFALGIDIGGTFTDVVVHGDGAISTFKAPSRPDDPTAGVIDAVEVSAAGLGMDVRELVSRCALIVHSTTRATNAVVTRATPPTAFLTTEGHPDILLLKEGGRSDAFDFVRDYPQPYIPQGRVFEVRERMLADGSAMTALDEDQVREIVARLKDDGITAVGVSFLWSIANPAHELRVRELIEEAMPDCFVSISHEVNPIVREYRRAIATAIDASLKPLMVEYLASLEHWFHEQGFSGALYTAASDGDLVTFADAAATPVRMLRSGPALAPVAAREFASADVDPDVDVTIVADIGGTTFDVSVIRNGTIARTTEMWVGEEFFSDLLGLPAIDVRSIGAGGGSIAWVDAGGMLRVGPDSAGAFPGPACYGRGGDRPTVTDAAVVLGILDPEAFLGGTMRLDEQAARVAIETHVARPLGVDLATAAEGVFDVSVEQMAVAVEALTVHQGVDPRNAVLVGGGGAAGMFLSRVGTRVGVRSVLFPSAAAVLAATGALASQVGRTFSGPFAASTASFDAAGVNAVLAGLRNRCETFLRAESDDRRTWFIDYSVEARYAGQLWEIVVPIRSGSFDSEDDVTAFVEAFHRQHEETFRVADPDGIVETVLWSAHASVAGGQRRSITVSAQENEAVARPRRSSFWGGTWREVDVLGAADISATGTHGPAIVESRLTTIVAGETATITQTGTGSVLLTFDPVRDPVGVA